MKYVISELSKNISINKLTIYIILFIVDINLILITVKKEEIIQFLFLLFWIYLVILFLFEDFEK